MTVTVVIGMQWGSEGKGKIANMLCEDANASVRVGGTNAGHTIYYGGNKCAMQTIPVGWTNPNCKLVIGAGALINIDILYREIELIKQCGHTVEGRLFIDPAVGIICDRHHEAETSMSLNLFNGSTCEGVGSATAERAMRKLKTFQEIPYLSRYCVDTVSMLNKMEKNKERIVIEGTQGLGLSLFTARRNGKIIYPKVTSREVTPSAILADCGLSVKNYKVVGVMRSFPIRVGWEEAGDMFGKELTWEEITKISGSPTPITEKTTVTKRTRRVAENDLVWMKEMCDMHNVDEIAYTFADYHNYKDFGVNSYNMLSQESRENIEKVQDACGVPINIISTGNLSEHTIWRM